MKKQSSRARAQSTPIVRHQLEHPVPTVIHDPEEKMTALGRFAHHAMLEPRRYLGWPLAIIGGLIVAALAWRMANSVTSNESEVWTKLEAARTPSERVDLAKANPRSPAATWAKLQAATGYFNEALADLPNNSDVALSALKKSLDLFDQVIREAPHDSAPARVAALGRARTLEMRNDLPKAIEQYELVAKEWPDSPEADEARHYAEALKDPQAAAFYKDLYAYSPTTVTIPSGGTETFSPSGLGSGFPGGLLNPGPAARTPASKSASDLRDLMVPGRNEVVEPKAGTPAPGAAPKSNPPAAKPETSKPAAMPTPGAPVAKPEAPRPAAVPNSGTPAPKPEAPKPAAMPKSAPPAAKPEATKPVIEPKASTPPASKPEATKPKSAPPASKPEAPKPVVEPKASNPPAIKPESPKPAAMPKPAPPAAKPVVEPKPNPPAAKPETPKPVAMPKPNPPAAKPEATKPVVVPKASNPPAAKPQAAKPAEKSKDLPDDVFAPKPKESS